MSCTMYMKVRNIVLRHKKNVKENQILKSFAITDFSLLNAAVQCKKYRQAEKT